MVILSKSDGHTWRFAITRIQFIKRAKMAEKKLFNKHSRALSTEKKYLSFNKLISKHINYIEANALKSSEKN